MPEPLVAVTRGDLIESVHRGHIVVTDESGSIIFRLGDPSFNLCLRSCAKPLQAVPVIATGAADRYRLTPAELAVMCGSLNGQDFQVATIRSILDKIGAAEGHLKCGIHQPSHRQTAQQLKDAGRAATPLHNNCAGKHAAMLTLCAHHGWPFDEYLSMQHPVQQLIRETIAFLTGVSAPEIGAGIDGCGVPVFFLPLAGLARAYARLASAADPHLSRLMDAALSHPEMIAGDERVCTDIMRALEKKVFAKTGAEGGYALSLMEKGWGVAIKIEDGSNRALSPAVIETLSQLGIVTRDELIRLQPYRRTAIYNHRKEIVGEVRACFHLAG
jgi:L-asparaginase II